MGTKKTSAKKRSNKAKPAKAKTAKPSTAKAAPAPTDPRAAYEFFLPRANALAGGGVPVARFPASVARTNVDKAVKAITPRLDELAKVAPAIETSRIRNLPALARALGYAEKQIPRVSSDGSIAAALAEVGPIRIAALSYLEAAAFTGLVDGGQVAAIRKGNGKLDVARDAVAIAGLFADNAPALDGKHPFTAEHLATLGETGAWLVDRLKPGGAVRDAKLRSPTELTKDRLAKLLEDDYGELQQAAAALWGVNRFAEHVPALHAHAQKRRAKKAPAKTADGAAAKSPAAP
jgi:hypothetical protein